MDDSTLLAMAAPRIAREEGCRLEAYKDTLGVWTIGYGHAHVEPGLCWTQSKADEQLRADLTAVITQLDRLLPWWRTLCDARRYVLLSMAFELGVRGLLGFRARTRCDPPPTIHEGRYALTGIQMGFAGSTPRPPDDANPQHGTPRRILDARRT